MAKAEVLDRVTLDLSLGHTSRAIQRLSSLVSSYPTDLDLRRRLAAVHRMVGNRIEAGRWAYVLPDADPAEVNAFERAYPTVTKRLTALRWPDAAHAASTATHSAALAAATGWDRLSVLAAAAHRGSRTMTTTRAWRIGATVAFTAGGVFSAVCVVVGAITVGQWIGIF